MTQSPPYYRLLLRFVPHWWLVTRTVLAMLLIATILAAIPFLMEHILDSIITARDPLSLRMSILKLAALAATGCIAFFFRQYLLSKISHRIGYDLYRDFFDKLLTLPIDAYPTLIENHHPDTQALGIQHISQSILQLMAAFIQYSLIILMMLVGIAHYSSEIPLLLLLLIIPLLILIVAVARDFAYIPAAKTTSRIHRLLDQLSLTLAHYRLIKLERGQICERERLSKIAESIFHAKSRHTVVKALLIAVGGTFFTALLCALGYLLALQVMHQTIRLPEAGALIAAVLLLLPPMLRLSSLPQRLAHDQTIVDNLFTFLDQASESHPNASHQPRLHGKLVFEQLQIADQSKVPIHLNGLTILPGETVVFKGFNNHQKNALVNLLLHIPSTLSGTILFDDQPLDSIAIDTLYANISWLTGETMLLDERIAGNIAYGAKRCAHETEITAAARHSHAISFIRHLPGGLQARIDDSDINLTPQQYHLLAIARALLKNAPVLILDETLVQQMDCALLCPALTRLMQQRTTLIFSSQLPSLSRIDHVIEWK